MGRWLSLAGARNWVFRFWFSRAGLKSATTDLGDGTVVHCWVPKTRREEKPNLMLVHGIGANAMWQWSDFIAPLVAHYNLYVPDLIFFGDSHTLLPDRSEAFQGRCMMGMLQAHGVKKTNVVGMSYGGFVAYSMAAQSPERVERLVLCCAGVCMEEKDREEAVAQLRTTDEAVSLLFPQTPDKMKELLGLCFHKPLSTRMPSWFLNDFIEVMCKQHFEERKELIEALYKDRNLCDLPRITQKDVLLIWGEYDRLFPLKLAHRLIKHVGEHVQLTVVKDAGHAIIEEARGEMLNQFMTFLVDPIYEPGNVSDRESRYWFLSSANKHIRM